ncbi:amidohydrolase family protein [Nocardiopsis sp. RSe5-2]|uniref:Amidohydrolase family protein n=1 Tax=Nocardiopsis endophytica TaxID=3018445 RepID=A0ABT4U759_9ACTN|nr:amidohydrolase family protein [Nocardiopsis endophytica]MDA2812761.1 amidohydrolase family protein [Nocardiopsis endophytica]
MPEHVTPPPRPVRFSGARLIDGTGAAPVEDAVVDTAADGTIAYAGPAAGAPAPAPGRQEVDLGGRTLLPGFFDCHVHLGLDNPRELVWNHLDSHASLQALAAADRMRRTLEAGVTSVRDLGGLDAGFRAAQERGLAVGPRLQVALRLISDTGGHADFTLPSGVDPHRLAPGAGETADGVHEARVAVRRLMRDGADVIKVCATGGISSPSDGPEDEGLSREEIAAVVAETGRRGGRPVAAHAQGAAGIRNAVLGGVSSVEHGYLVDDEGIDLMLERGTFLVPTLATFDFEHRRHLMTEKAYRAKQWLAERTFDRIPEAVRRGVRVALGTDAGVSEHGRNLAELGFLVRVGLSPMEAIVAGTRSSAELLGVADRLGTVEHGKLADLVVCQGDPLLDVGVLAEPDNVVVVVQGGRVVKDIRA